MAQAVWVNGSRTLTITLNTTEAPEFESIRGRDNIPTTNPAADVLLSEGGWTHLIDLCKELQFLGLSKAASSPTGTTNVVRKNH